MLRVRVRAFLELNFCLRLYDEVRGSISACHARVCVVRISPHFFQVFCLCFRICLLQVFIAIAACVAAFFFISRDKPVKTKSVQVKHTHTHTHTTCVEASRKVAGRQLL